MRKFEKNALILSLIVGLVYIFCVSLTHSEMVEDKADSSKALIMDTELIDVPTAGTLDYYGFQLRTRFFSGGGVLNHIAFGVLPRLNLGASATVENLIGNGTPVRLVRPAIQVKYRFYDGSLYIPAFAVGYDGQGQYYNSSTRRFSEKQRGLYVAASHEVLIPNLFVHPGINFAEFESEDIYFFLASNLIIEDRIGLMFEWDHIHNFKDSLINVGARFYVTPFFHFDFAFRAIGKNDTFPDGAARKTERIVTLRYHTTF